MGSWGIDGLEVLDCGSQQPLTADPYSRAYSHEEIGSFCHKSSLMGGEDGIARAEGEWAQSEVGEGVEEVWERAWMTAGRYISTLAPKCIKGEASSSEVPSFFNSLHKLHGRFPTAKLLADADITPSADTTYSLSELAAALAFDDHKPIVTCDNMTLFSVSWPLHVTGTFQSGSFSASSDLKRTSQCPAEGIIYPPSTTLPPTTTSYAWDDIHRPTPRPITLSHDESKVYQPVRGDPEQLKFFKGTDEVREGQKEGLAGRQFWRDEL